MSGIDIRYHKRDNCAGYYFMPCGCAIGDTWCFSCKNDQLAIQANPIPEISLTPENNVHNILKQLKEDDKDGGA